MVPAAAVGAEPGAQFRLEEKDGGRQRFLVELEFVQALANPAYIHCNHPRTPSHPLTVLQSL